MASFIIKHTVGKQLDSVKGAVGGGDDKGDDENAEEEAAAIEEARREAEEKRKDKHRKMEQERETIRQEIRDKGLKLMPEQREYRILEAGIRCKYNIKKREPISMEDPGAAGQIGRKRKTPAELAAEANQEEDESVLPAQLTDISSKVTGLTSGVTDKCVVQ